MGRKRHSAEEVINKLRQADVELGKATWAEAEGKGVGPEGRWRSFEYNDLIKRDKANLDIFWLKDKSLEDGDDLPEPDVLAQEIADDLETALEQFRAIESELKQSDSR